MKPMINICRKFFKTKYQTQMNDKKNDEKRKYRQSDACDCNHFLLSSSNMRTKQNSPNPLQFDKNWIKCLVYEWYSCSIRRHKSIAKMHWFYLVLIEFEKCPAVWCSSEQGVVCMHTISFSLILSIGNLRKMLVECICFFCFFAVHYAVYKYIGAHGRSLINNNIITIAIIILWTILKKKMYDVWLFFHGQRTKNEKNNKISIVRPERVKPMRKSVGVKIGKVSNTIVAEFFFLHFCCLLAVFSNFLEGYCVIERATACIRKQNANIKRKKQ